MVLTNKEWIIKHHIFATDECIGTNTIKSDDDSTNVTINNFKGGHIYHTSESAVL